ncbi:uncharacterized protein LOC108100116 [Drosophila ficusphila]|uniref:uncharacterized protein LOC108100116 n=1 Tax=Drosophila ficusphila TaxID=30025 RepID=UPI0007E5D012|nr:uncharacterized protein LOC108100116 [Drosophila ficusphila]XP_017059355.1 uncharacterized protein LOC108100116 [Drosophila ficusphila]
MNSFENAVEFDHDENLLNSKTNVSHLTEFLALLNLKSSEEHSDEKLMQLKREADLLDWNSNSPNYYFQKEELIFKVVCEIKGIDHDEWLRMEQGSPSADLFADFLADQFVCDGI